MALQQSHKSYADILTQGCITKCNSLLIHLYVTSACNAFIYDGATRIRVPNMLYVYLRIYIHYYLHLNQYKTYIYNE